MVDVDKDNPVICADCRNAGIIILKDGKVLVCELVNRPIWNSKPIWCPKAQD